MKILRIKHLCVEKTRLRREYDILKDKKYNTHQKQKIKHTGISDVKLVSFEHNIFARNYPEHLVTSEGFEHIEK